MIVINYYIFNAYFDDGEKFGVWPNTYDWVYTKGWLKNFIKAIMAEKEIEFMHYEEAVKKVKPSGHVESLLLLSDSHQLLYF